ncbi:DUF748 domain-containing protein [Sphaerotilus sp.]|uniref:DUF748 domain-containing protein n=1 Tax=Sphaerotilus sp. TaxID=2093942 RepID=UPI002ACD9E1E|nr:DUF748 domain-containing protein [Sphaerotilus sp.]MDZ7857974.1 DUF748 domain-containing protein [Sphaerotilus sp.]
MVGLGVVAWLGVPPLLKSQVEQHASAALGRPVQVGRIDFKPWTLELTAEQLAIGAALGAASPEPLLKIARLHANADLRSVLNLAPVLTALEIDQPEIRLTRTAEGHYDIDDLIARFSTPTPAQPDAKPAQFALYNVQLRGGQVTFDDQPLQRQHVLKDLTLAVPFLSNLPSQVDIEVTPRLAFKLDGTAFDSAAKTKPFTAARTTEAQFKLAPFDLAPWLGYWPDTLPVKLQKGRLQTDLALHFDTPATGTPHLRLTGTFGAHDLALTDRAGAALVGWDALDVALRDVQPLARQVTLGAVTLDGLVLDVSRDAQGRLSLTQLAGPADAAPPPAAATPAAPAWQLKLDALALQNTRVRWRDATTQPAAALTLAGLDLETGAVQWPLAAPVTLKLSTTLHGGGAYSPAQGKLTAQGEASDRGAQVDLQIERLALAALQPYLNASLKPQLSGALSASGQLRWAAAADQTPAQLQLDLKNATVNALQLADRSAGPIALASLGQLQLDGAAIDLNAHTVALARVQLGCLDTRLARDAKGQWNVLQWLVPQPPSPPASPPWQVTLKDLQLQDGRLQFTDAQVASPVQLDIAQLNVGLQNLALRGDQLTTPLRWQLGANVAPMTNAATASAKGKAPASRTLDGRGELSLAPLRVTSNLKVQNFPVHALEPYFGEALGLSLLRAHLGYEGTLALQDGPAGLNVALKGDGRVGDVQLHTRRTAQHTSDELLSWQALTLQGLDVALKPPQKPKVVIGALGLNDFYSKLVITEDGRFNLQDVGPAPSPAASAVSEPAASAPPVPASAPAKADELTVDLTITATRLSNGRVDFTDRFVRPNYSADLSELQGTLGTLRTGTREMAEITLRGKVARTGTLDLSGQINPTASPPVMDLRARAADLELTPLSPYAGKYAGYGIERGKLTMDVAYRITPEGQLAATNKLVLNQLTFGERVESPTATQLPVLLAVALLQDRNGVIDLDLPIGGSLNDPQFSVFGLVLKVIGNVLTKAITAPFAFLSGGGDDDLSVVTFEPGTAVLTAEGRTAADKVAKALQDRPALHLTLTGWADGLTERAAYQRAAVERQVLAAWRQEREKAGDAPEVVAESVPMPADRARLLDTLLRQSARTPAAAAKPATKASAPAAAASRPAEVDPAAALADAVPVSADIWRELAAQRGTAVRDALLARQLPNERLFLAAPKVQSEAAGTDTSSANSGKPRAELTLSAR